MQLDLWGEKVIYDDREVNLYVFSRYIKQESILLTKNGVGKHNYASVNSTLLQKAREYIVSCNIPLSINWCEFYSRYGEDNPSDFFDTLLKHVKAAVWGLETPYSMEFEKKLIHESVKSSNCIGRKSKIIKNIGFCKTAIVEALNLSFQCDDIIYQCVLEGYADTELIEFCKSLPSFVMEDFSKRVTALLTDECYGARIYCRRIGEGTRKHHINRVITFFVRFSNYYLYSNESWKNLVQSLPTDDICFIESYLDVFLDFFVQQNTVNENELYRMADFFFQRSRNSKAYMTVAKVYKSLGDYGDSRDKAKICENRLIEYQKKDLYNQAVGLLQSQKYLQSKELFRELYEMDSSYEYVKIYYGYLCDYANVLEEQKIHENRINSLKQQVSFIRSHATKEKERADGYAGLGILFLVVSLFFMKSVVGLALSILAFSFFVVAITFFSIDRYRKSKDIKVFKEKIGMEQDGTSNIPSISDYLLNIDIKKK